MPSSTEKQAKFMSAIAHGWKPSKGGPSKAVAKDFHEADKKKGEFMHSKGGHVSCPKCGHYFAGGDVEMPQVPDYEHEKKQRDLWSDMYGEHHDHGEGPIHFDEGGEVEIVIGPPPERKLPLSQRLADVYYGETDKEDRKRQKSEEEEEEKDGSWRSEEGYARHHRDELASDESGRYARGGFAKRLANRSGFKPFLKK